MSAAAELHELKVGDRVSHREDMGPPFTFGGEVVEIEPNDAQGRYRGHIGVIWRDEPVDEEVGEVVQFFSRNDLIHPDDPDAKDDDACDDETHDVDDEGQCNSPTCTSKGFA